MQALISKKLFLKLRKDFYSHYKGNSFIKTKEDCFFHYSENKCFYFLKSKCGGKFIFFYIPASELAFTSFMSIFM